jgi:hypothetical protein
VSQFINLTTPVGTGSSAGLPPQPTSLLIDLEGQLLVGLSPDHNRNGAVQKYDLVSGAFLGTLVSNIGTPSGLALIPPIVAGRHIFYNNSAFDGNQPAAGASDDGAIAPDKTALLPGQTAGFANYTGYSKGINGLMIDLRRPAGALPPTAADFAFHVGNDNNPSAWAAAPPPTSVSVRPGAGVGGSDRVTLIWPDAAIKKTWLQVTVLATANTGLSAPDVFYFGNAVGEVGNSTTNAVVSSADEALIRLNGRNALNPAPIDWKYDIDRNKVVGSSDQALCRLNASNALNSLRLIVAPAEAGMVGSEAALIDAALASSDLGVTSRHSGRRSRR